MLAHVPGGGVYVQGAPLHRNPQEGIISSQEDLFKYDVVILQDVPRSYFRVGGDTTESRLQNVVQFVTKRGGAVFATFCPDMEPIEPAPVQNLLGFRHVRRSASLGLAQRLPDYMGRMRGVRKNSNS